MLEAETDIDKLRETIINKQKHILDKKKIVQGKLKYFNENFRLTEKNLTKNLCENIVIDIINLSIFESLGKEEMTLDARTNALKMAVGKIFSCESTINNIKRNLEKEALKILINKNEINDKVKLIKEKAENVDVISHSIKKTDKNILKIEDNLKKREEMHAQKLKQIEALERQIELKEAAIIEKEKKRNDLTPEKRKICENPFSVRENAVKQKEIEINNRNKILEEKKKQIEEYKSKIK